MNIARNGNVVHALVVRSVVVVGSNVLALNMRDTICTNILNVVTGRGKGSREKLNLGLYNIW